MDATFCDHGPLPYGRRFKVRLFLSIFSSSSLPPSSPSSSLSLFSFCTFTPSSVSTVPLLLVLFPPLLFSPPSFSPPSPPFIFSLSFSILSSTSTYVTAGYSSILPFFLPPPLSPPSPPLLILLRNLKLSRGSFTAGYSLSF